jgi:hypothetical protein
LLSNGFLNPGAIDFSNTHAEINTTDQSTLIFSISSMTNATCADVINDSVSYDLWSSGGGTNNVITATFIPNLGYTLAQAAKLCNFIEFDWQQTITSWPLPSGLFGTASSTTPVFAPPAFNDPPPPNGYPYMNSPGSGQLPVYWNPFSSDFYSLAINSANPSYPTSGNVCEQADAPVGSCLSTYDVPSDACLPVPGTSTPSPSFISYVKQYQYPRCVGGTNNATYSYIYNGKRYYYDPKGSYNAFTTHLVGLQGSLPGAAVIDTGIGFSWNSNYNGTTGGISASIPVTGPNGFLPADPGSGTGGITITVVNETTSYQYPTNSGAAPAATLLTATQITYTASGLVYSRTTKTFDGSITITNISDSTITGPFQIVLDSLTGGVTLSNATSTFGGWSYVTVPNAGGLAPGQSATAQLQFADPTDVTINFTPLIYAGSFN